MAKKKKKIKNNIQDYWEWEVTEDEFIIDHLQKLANHMVLTGIEMGPNGDPEKRLDRLEAIMESGEWELSQEEMDLYLPKSTIKEYLYKFSTKKDFECRSMFNEDYLTMLNKLSEMCVYGLMKKLADIGYLKLCWDPNKNDFIYMPNTDFNDDGESWKKY